MKGNEMGSTCKFQLTVLQRLYSSLEAHLEGSTWAHRSRVTAEQEQCLAYQIFVTVYKGKIWISLPFEANMRGWNTSNDMWDWIQLCSHTFWVWDFLKHSLFTSVPSESRQAPGWWAERETDKQHWLYEWTNAKTSSIQSQTMAWSSI